jgi:hypothetical protein
MSGSAARPVAPRRALGRRRSRFTLLRYRELENIHVPRPSRLLIALQVLVCLLCSSPTAIGQPSSPSHQRPEIGNIWRKPERRYSERWGEYFLGLRRPQADAVEADRASCEANPTAAWIAVSGQDFCARYYLAEGRINPREAIVYLTGDVPDDPLADLQQSEVSMRALAHRIAQDGLTGILLARMGTFGSSAVAP